MEKRLLSCMNLWLLSNQVKKTSQQKEPLTENPDSEPGQERREGAPVVPGPEWESQSQEMRLEKTGEGAGGRSVVMALMCKGGLHVIQHLLKFQKQVMDSQKLKKKKS